MDITAGCAVFASMPGVMHQKLGAVRSVPKPKIKLSDRLNAAAQEAAPCTGKHKLSELRSRKNG